MGLATSASAYSSQTGAVTSLPRPLPVRAYGPGMPAQAWVDLGAIVLAPVAKMAVQDGR
jgi:hypothetical protein